REAIYLAHTEGSDKQAKLRDRGGIGVEIHPIDRIKGALGEHRTAGSRLTLLPLPEKPRKCPDEKVPGSARGVDQQHLVKTELGDRRLEGAVEDELLNKDRGLQQRVALLRCLGKVLVEVAEEPRVKSLVGEVVDKGARLRIYLRPQLAQHPRAIRSGTKAP